MIRTKFDYEKKGLIEAINSIFKRLETKPPVVTFQNVHSAVVEVLPELCQVVYSACSNQSANADSPIKSSSIKHPIINTINMARGA